MDNNNYKDEVVEDSDKPIYIDLVDLDDIKDNEIKSRVTELISVLNVDNIEKWLPQFNSIMDLRRLLKFRRPEFLKAFNEIYKSLCKQINSLRSGCSKIALVLMSELFSNSKDIQLDWIDNLLPAVIAKAAFIQKFIKEEAINVLNNVSANMFVYHVLDILVQNVGNKNVSQSEAAFDCLCKLIDNWNEKQLVKINELPHIVPKIVEVYKLKKEPYNKKSLKIVMCLYEKLGKDNFEKMVNVVELESKNMIENILKQAKEKQGMKKDSGNLRDHIKKVKDNDEIKDKDNMK